MAQVRQNTFPVKIASNPPSILVIEDDPDSLMVLSYVFEGFPYTLHCAADGHSGLIMASQECPDLILLDMVLPDISGFDLVRRLKSAPGTCQIPVIAVTALAFASERSLILSAGCDGYLSKPYSIDDVEVLVKSYLEEL